MFTSQFQLNFKNPVLWFCFGWSLILVGPLLPIIPHLPTFMHPWRAELAASILFLITLGYLFYYHRDKAQLYRITRNEINFIILPLLTFIAWSGISILWAPSWKSAFYHTLVWAEYLIFYLIARHILENKNGLFLFLLPLTVTLLIIGIPTILEYVSFLITGGETTIGIRFAKYGELFNTVFPIITVVILRLNGKRFLLGLIVIMVLWFFTISTLGRTNLLVFALELIVILMAVFVFKRFHKYRLRMAAIVLGAILLPIPFHSIAFLNEKPNVPMVQRINDETSINYSANLRKLLQAVSFEMFYENPLIGLGANNYGLQFNNYRVLYAQKNPTDINLMTAENEIAERAHNEYLQILAELGIIGSLIFIWFLCGILIMCVTLLMRMRRASLFPFAMLLGLASFLTSSFVSSFSFRFVPNGFAFFLILAIAAKSLMNNSSGKSFSAFSFSPKLLKFGYAAGSAACLLLASYCLTRATGAYYLQKALVEREIEKAKPYYQKAVLLDSENPNIYYSYGMNLFIAERYAEAVPYLREAIAAQRATSIEYSYLATAQSLSSDNIGAEETIASALKLYPFSTFVRTRYATLLKQNGKQSESARQFEVASEISKLEANTWWVLMNEGARKASFRAFQDKNFIAVMRLKPKEAIYAVTTEREIKYPEEKFNIKFDGD